MTRWAKIFKNFKWPPLKSFFKNGDLLFEDKKEQRWPSLPRLGLNSYYYSFCIFVVSALALTVFFVSISSAKYKRAGGAGIACDSSPVGAARPSAIICSQKISK